MNSQKTYQPIQRCEPFTIDDEGIVQTVPLEMFNFPTLHEDHEELAKSVTLFIESDPDARTKMVAGGFHRDEIETLDMLGRGEITPEESMDGILNTLQTRWNSVRGLPNG